MATIPSRKPVTRQISGKSLSNAISGKEKDYPVYRFSKGRRFYERPKNNPFDGL